MLMLNPPYALWSIWKNISILERSLLLLLCAVGIYSIFVAISTELSLRSMKQNGSGEDQRAPLAALCNRYENLQQIIRGAFYLFGLILFLGFQNVGFYLGDGRESGASYVLGNFILHCAFAANVFFIFLAFHFLLWFVWRRLMACAKTVQRGPMNLAT